MTGRIVLSSYETLRATGKNVICLSPVRRPKSNRMTKRIIAFV